MKSFLPVLALLSWCMAFPFPAAAENIEHLLKVLSPPDKAVVAREAINLVFLIKSDSIDAVRVTANREAPRLLRNPAARQNIGHERFPLAAGNNLLRIEAMKGGKTVAETTRTILQRPALSSQAGLAEPGFTEYFFHAGQNEKVCLPCHGKELRAAPGQPGRQPSCLSCHQDTGSSKFAHGPVSVGECAFCHSRHTADRKNGVPDPEGNACRTCHTEEMAGWAAKTHGHGPAVAGQCALCHAPHGSDEPYLLVRNEKALCLTCHGGQASLPHLGMSTSKPPPRPCAKNKQSAGACSSCHDPHAENNSNLLRHLKGSR